ncbi:MAG: two-component sensor histidine kinase [Spirochaetales bacterium]|nr:two-component sensor histidine kinase [Spirochaetales bacterium]
MRRRRWVSPILVFTIAQLAWFALLGLWIYWYVSNYMIFIEVGERISPQFVFSTVNIALLVGGIVLLMAVAMGLALIFSRLNEQLKLNKMYDSFIANVTHELKSPLASIQLYLETLGSREVPPSRRDEFINLMLRDSQRLNALISSILEISGLEDKKKVYKQEFYRADELVRSLVAETREQYNLNNNALHIAGSADCICRVDWRSMKVVLNNLVDNAIKYTAGELHIEVGISSQAGKFIIEVRDRGIGILEEDHKEIFKKFRRVANPDSPTVKGTGLGLYWVREIIRHHRGKISVDSAGLTRGTTFRIELPTYPANKLETTLPAKKETNA